MTNEAPLDNLQSAAAAGDAEAQFNLGALLYNGVDGAPDLAQVYRWWTLATRQRHLLAEQNVPVMSPQLTAEQLARAQADVATGLRG